MKKLSVVILLLFSFSLISCGKNTDSNKTVETPTIKTPSLKTMGEEYRKKLDLLDSTLKKEDRLNKASTTTEMRDALSYELTQWDKYLNEIYNYLKSNLDKNTFEKLKNEEILWIKSRDEKAQKDADVYKGGTLERVEYIGSQKNSTKNRCYELLDKYFK